MSEICQMRAFSNMLTDELGGNWEMHAHTLLVSMSDPSDVRILTVLDDMKKITGTDTPPDINIVDGKLVFSLALNFSELWERNGQVVLYHLRTGIFDIGKQKR